MGKPFVAAPNRQSLRCVHCRTSETPLWRSGPDGPKTLCNACGVRFKKGKLTLYRDKSGALTAVKQPDTEPVVVPPPSKKPLKKIPSSASLLTPSITTAAHTPTKETKTSAPDADRRATPATVPQKPRQQISSANGMTRHPPITKIPDDVQMLRDENSSAPRSLTPAFAVPVSTACAAGQIRKLDNDASFTSTVAKKARNRTRRMTAGQIPGRYQIPTNDHTRPQLHSPPRMPPSSMHSNPMPLTSSDWYSCQDDFLLGSRSAVYDVDEPTPFPFTDLAVDNMFADVACLGLDSSDDKDMSHTPTLLPMAADPSSAEHFSLPDQTAFAYSPSLMIEPPDRRTALVSLVRDCSRAPGRLYQACVRAIVQLGQRLILRSVIPASSTEAERRRFVRDFASDNRVLGAPVMEEEVVGSNGIASGGKSCVQQPCRAMAVARFLLQDRIAYETAVDAFRALCDCPDLSIFPEDLVLQVLEDDVVAWMAPSEVLGSNETDGSGTFGLQHDRDRTRNPISARA